MSTAAPAKTSPEKSSNSDKSAKPSSSGYDVARSAGVCCICQKQMVANEQFTAALKETPASMERLDFCAECTDKLEADEMLAVWKTVMPEEKPKAKLFVDDDVLCTLFEKLGSAQELLKIQFRFVLGLILMRKRRLAYESTKREGATEFWVVRFRGGENRMDLVNPALDEELVVEVSQQLNQILSEEL